jgi:hypothetical protein
VPDLVQRAVLPVNRVAIGQRHGGDVGEDLVPLGRVAAAQVPAHCVGIGADDEQVVARAGVAVPGSGRQDEDVAAADLEAASARAAEDDRG